MLSLIRTAALCAVFSISSFAAWPAPQPVVLTDAELQPAELVVVTPDGDRVSYTPNALEELPTYRIVTNTPWRDGEAVFEGVLLHDLLQKHGLTEAPAIRISAEDEYVSVIETSVLTNARFMIATRVDGKPHSRRARGPLQIVVDESVRATVEGVDDRHLVWGVTIIEAVD